jgi:CRISPR-associated protein Csb2
MLALQWDYLLGKAFASQWESGRSAPEWPPHPDRVFQALVAAWGETGCDPAQAAALRWLEALPPPGLAVPAVGTCADHPVFVPTNDIESQQKKYGEPMLGLLPTQRHKAERHFPATAVSSPCALVWPDAMPDAAALAALRMLCAQVTHVGMATSLVRMWVTDAGPTAMIVPSQNDPEMRLRVPHAGRLDALLAAYANGGKDWRRPPVARWIGYARDETVRARMPQSVFGADWLVFCRTQGTCYDLAQAPVVAETMRATLIKAADGDAVAMTLISGHCADGTRTESPHVAFVPLGDVGHEYADGHLLGVALVLPRALAYDERDAVMRALVKAQNVETSEIVLRLGNAGTVTLVAEQRDPPPRALRPETWCKPAPVWASVTPIVLDRLPPRSKEDYAGWAAEQVSAACARIGLPRPVAVTVQSVSRFSGAPVCRDVAPLPRRTDGGPRWHVHAEIEFGVPVCGPVLLGAGRYRGYGICRPCGQEVRQ